MAKNQSWTAWILESYSSSFYHDSEPQDDESSNLEDDTRRPNTRGPIAAPPFESRTPSASSELGPFVKSGRGGAGNFAWQSERPRQDIEPQRQSSLTDRQKAAAQIEHLDTAEELDAIKRRRKRSSQYLQVGIGGAGYLSLRQSNEIQSPRSPSFTNSSTNSPLLGAFPRSPHGRGGVGNYQAAMARDKEVENEKEFGEWVAAERTRDKVEQDVQKSLRPPQGALLSEGRRRESMD